MIGKTSKNPEGRTALDPVLGLWRMHEMEMDALQAVSRVMSHGTDHRELLQEILGVLEEKLAVSRGTVMILSPDGDGLTVEAVAPGGDSARHGASYKKGEGIVGEVLATGEPAIVPLLAEDPRFQGKVHRRSKDQDLSFICVPVRVGKDAVGTLSVDLPPQDPARLKEMARVLEIVASLIANDISNRRMARIWRENLERENQRLRTELSGRFRPENILGESSGMRLVFTRIHQVAASTTTVLIRGESGTGKELVASAIHFNSPRASKPLVKVNCAALSENLLESELFGHERGAFTGALNARIGRVEEAEGGTLFLDEIGEFSGSIQVKLLRLLQEREYERVGANRTRKANVRIIAATNRDLEKAVEEGAFRQDLYYRVNVFPLHLPPLRDRKSDILQLTNHFVIKHSERMGKEVRRISTPAINMLAAYHWPGNVRELENCIEYALLLCRDGVIHGHDLPPTLQMPEEAAYIGAAGSLHERVAILERDLISDALKRAAGNVSAAARELGTNERVLRYKIGKLGLAKQGKKRIYPGS
jgi:Nif-specific regulatory protein